MPFLAAVSAGSAVAKAVGISFKTPSEKRARKVIPAVVASANGGNLNAVAVLDSRSNNSGTARVGVAKERAEWSKGYAQVSAAVLAQYMPLREKLVASVPASAQASPEAAASWATGNQYQAPILDQVAAPIEAAGSAQAAAFREATAQTAERIGVGGGAAVARAARGTEGPLDRLIAYTQKPTGLFVVAGVAVVLVGGVAYIIGRR